MMVEPRSDDNVPSDRQLRTALDDFRVWVKRCERPPDAAPRVRLMEVVGMSRATFYGICDAGQMWTARRRSPYWAWQKRRRGLWSMDGVAIVRLSDEFRAVSVALKQPLSAVSQSWWDNNGGFGALGIEVLGFGDEVEIVLLGDDGQPVEGQFTDGVGVIEDRIDEGNDVLERIFPMDNEGRDRSLLSENARIIMEERYLLKDEAGEAVESPEGLFRRVSRAVAQGEREGERSKWDDTFYDLMSSLRFLPNSPTLVNAGTGGRGCLSACFVVSPTDNMESIMKVASDAAMIEKWGGGIGFGFSKLRPRLDRIATTHGEACGPIAVMKLYSSVGATLTQGSFRLGAHMGQLSVSHPDVREFIHCKDNDDTLENFNISVQITDEFMRAVDDDAEWTFYNPRDVGEGAMNSPAGTVRARELWRDICESAWKTGDPGVVFMDRVWETQPNPQMGDIETSNPCVAGETPVSTAAGVLRVSDLVGRQFTALVDGEPYPSTESGFFSQGEKPVVLLKTTVGHIKLTADHKVWSSDSDGWVEAGGLTHGDRLRLHTHASGDTAMVLGVSDAGSVEVYDCSIPGPNAWDSRGIYISNCGEEFLEDYGNCCLGSINLDKHVSGSGFDFAKLSDTVRDAVRFLDDVIEINEFPIQKLRDVNLATRRIGLGVMGWADALVRLGIPYDSPEALELTEEVAGFIHRRAWEESASLAEERGAYPGFEKSALKTRGMKPVRNSSVVTIAPTGTISRLADCSSGIEPHFANAWWSNVLWKGQGSGSAGERLLDAPKSVWEALRDTVGDEDEVRRVLEGLADDPASGDSVFAEIDMDPALFRTSMEISAEAHVRMQAAWQKYVTNSVSKTVNLPNDASVEDVEDAYRLAWETDCKAVTVYRDGSKSRQVLETGSVGESVGDEGDFVVPRERPMALFGITEKVRTGHGTMYVTLNFDDNGKPFELFTAIGKAGGSEPAHLEGLSRMVTLCLRSGVDPNAVIYHLNGITSEPVWDDGVLIRSAEDGVAHVLKRHLNGPNRPGDASKNSDSGAQLGLFATPKFPGSQGGVVPGALSDGCVRCGGKVVYQEGCARCLDCDHTRCE